MLETLRGVVAEFPAGTVFATGGQARSRLLLSCETRMAIGPHFLKIRVGGLLPALPVYFGLCPAPRIDFVWGKSLAPT